MSENGPLVQLSDVWKSYESGESETLDVLRGITLDVRAGEAVAIVGPSGSGKSTLLNIIGTLDRPSRGSVLLDGRDVSAADDAELARIRNREIGFVFQLHHLLPQCTVLENVLVPTLPLKDGGGNAEERARTLLDRVGLGKRLTHRPAKLSGGERQRVAVVRALINRPKLLLADEPTGSLDLDSSGRLAELLAELNREENVALVLVTHSLKLASRMEHTLELAEGVLSEQEAAR